MRQHRQAPAQQAADYFIAPRQKMQEAVVRMIVWHEHEQDALAILGGVGHAGVFPCISFESGEGALGDRAAV